MPLDHDSAVGHSFGLEFEGVNVVLMDVVGLVLSVFGLDRGATRPQPASVTLVRGLTSDRHFVQWVHEAQARKEGAVARQTTVVVFAHDGSPVARYHLENAWPSKLEIGTLKAGDTSVVAERLTLTFDRVEVE
jgi:phage tail-like protein